MSDFVNSPDYSAPEQPKSTNFMQTLKAGADIAGTMIRDQGRKTAGEEVYNALVRDEN